MNDQAGHYRIEFELLAAYIAVLPLRLGGASTTALLPEEAQGVVMLCFITCATDAAPIPASKEVDGNMSYVRGTYKLVQPQQAPPTPVQTLDPIESAPSSIADKTHDPSDVRISALQ